MKSRRLHELPQAEITFPNPDKGYFCECCGSYLKRYFRKMNANMAMTLILLVRKKKFGYVPIEEFLRTHGCPRSGDFSYLVHYGMLEKMTGERLDGSKKNGFYKVTDKGRQFALKQITVPQTFIIYNGKCEGFEGREIGIEDALGKKFDYRELMSGDYKMYTVK